MRKTITLLIVLLGLISLVLATNHAPPSFDFQQFYGSVSGISAVGYKVRATIGTTPFETPIAANGQYGYSPTFKVYGQNGQSITFFIVAPSGTTTAVGNPVSYTNSATTRLDFTYSQAPPGGQSGGGTTSQCGNNLREAPEVCDGTDLAGQSCASQVGAGSMGTLRCAANCMTFNTTHNFDTSQCTAASVESATCWDCHEWGSCRNGRETRNCQPADCSVVGVIRSASEPGEERSCRSTTGTTTTTGPSSCQMNWECGAWSLCRNSQQSRICFRVDNCDTLQTQNPTMTITSIPKPAEERSCQEGTTATQQQLCSPGLKRCLGPQLQLCSTDGSQWSTLQACPSSCDSISLTCRVEQVVSPPSTQKPSSVWMYLLAGSVVLVLIIVGLSMVLLNKKKYAPAKEYIRESRVRGIDDEQIREKLVEEGWEEKGVGKLFK